MIGKLAKTEKILILAALAFLLLEMGLFFYDGAAGDGSCRVETQYQVAASSLVPPDDGKININTATAEELTRLPGIGDVLAKRIVADREANGMFAAIEDIQRVNGIGEGKFSELKDQITVEEEAG